MLNPVVLNLACMSSSSINGSATVLQGLRYNTLHITFVHLPCLPLGTCLESVTSQRVPIKRPWMIPEIVSSPLLLGYSHSAVWFKILITQ